MNQEFKYDINDLAKFELEHNDMNKVPETEVRKTMNVELPDISAEDVQGILSDIGLNASNRQQYTVGNITQLSSNSTRDLPTYNDTIPIRPKYSSNANNQTGVNVNDLTAFNQIVDDMTYAEIMKERNCNYFNTKNNVNDLTYAELKKVLDNTPIMSNIKDPTQFTSIADEILQTHPQSDIAEVGSPFTDDDSLKIIIERFGKPKYILVY